VARTGGLAIGLAAVLAIAGCASTKPKRDPVETRSKAEVGAEVQSQADQIAKLVGKPLQNAKVNPALCVYRVGKTGDGSIFVMQGTYQIALPEGEHVSTGARVRDAWKATGWTITEDTTKDKTMDLAATTPAKYTVRLGSTQPPNALVVLVQSPCYRDPDVS
jgi:hypothetical protein